MLKKHHRFFQSIQILRDILLVGSSLALAYWVRFSFPAALPFETASNFRETGLVGLMLVVAWPVVGWIGNLYVSRRSRSVLSEVFDVFKTTVLVFLVVVALTYFFRDVRYSRLVMMLWAGLVFSLVSLARVAARILMRGIRARGFNLRHVVIVGAGDLAKRVTSTVEAEAWLGLRIAGYVIPVEDEGLDTTELRYPVLGTVGHLQAIVGQHQVDQVLVALPIERLGALRGIMNLLSLETVDVRMVPDVYQYMTLCGGIEELSGMPVINLQLSPLSGWSRVFKRSFDFIFTCGALLVAAPLMMVIALGIRCSGRGPIFFAQERVGMDGSTFNMHKFRTMRVDAEARGSQMTDPNDDRRTWIGIFLRKTSLDELPQLWNVLLGDMSLVGPRPEQPCFIEDFKREIPRYALRHKVKAGMTGWAQVNGMRGQTSIAKRIEMDLYYIENWSLLLDFKILVRTICGGFLSPNAY